MTMTEAKSELNSDKFSENIYTIQRAVEENPLDLVTKLNLASALEQEKHYYQAIATYQEIIDQDDDGVFADSAKKAIENLKKNFSEDYDLPLDEKKEDSNSLSNVLENTKKITNIIPKINNFPIGIKQFIALLMSSLISMLGVILAGRFITINLGRNQLENQAVSELTTSVINYDFRLSEIETNFKGLKDNSDIIKLVKDYRNTLKIDPNLKTKVKKILIDDVSLKQIEYATIVGLDNKIIVNANQDRTGEVFNPNNLVEDVLSFPRSVKTNAIIPRSEIEQEKPPLNSPLKEENVLMNLIINPIVDPNTKKMIGLLIAGEVVNGKTLSLKKTIDAVGGGYGAVYLYKDDKFVNVTSLLKTKEGDFKKNIPLPDVDLLHKAELGMGGDLVNRQKIGNQWFTIAIKDLPDNEGNPTAFIVRGTPEANLNQLLIDSLRLQSIVGVIILILAVLLAYILGKALTNPIKRLQQSAQKIGAGDLKVRAEVTSKDEVGQLAKTFNEMAERIEAYTQAIEDIARKRQNDAAEEKKQRDELQENVVSLLLDIEAASKGNLSVQAQVVSGEVGSIADAFNSTIRSLQGLVKQVVVAGNEVHESALNNGKSVDEFSQNATLQDQTIQVVSVSVKEIAEAIEMISESAQNASNIARESCLVAQQGEKTMDETVNSIYEVRNSVADTSKKAKRLADSSQEISKIVSIIANISEKTNLLAFNASIEAARAGENGQGFRVVADEVRRLAEQVSVSAEEIEQLVISIQEETSDMMKMMEKSTTQVVTNTKLVKKTKETLQNLAKISQEIDGVLEVISQSTVTQKLTSQKVTNKMQEVSLVTKKTATESKIVSESLQNLVKVANNLQQSAGRFQV